MTQTPSSKVAQTKVVRGSVPHPTSPPPSPPASGARPEGSTGFLGRLSVGQKLGLAGLVLGLPFAGLALSKVADYVQRLNTVERQVEGQQLIDPIRQALINTQLTRLATANYANGAISKQELEQQRNIVEKQLDIIIKGAKEDGFSNLYESAVEAQQSFDLINRRVDNGSLTASESIVQFTSFIDQYIVPIFADVASDAQLRTASNTELAELSLLLTENMPAELPQAGSIISATSRMLNDIGGKGATVPPEASQALRLRWETAYAAQNATLRRIQRTASLSPELSAALSPIYNDLKASGDNIFNPIMGGIIQAQRATIGVEDIQNNLPAFVEGQFGGYERGIALLGERLEAERAAVQRSLILVSLLTLLGLALAAALLYYISRAITEPLGRLTGAAQQLTRGHFGARVPVTTSDEIGTLTSSFNTAAMQLQANEERVARERREQEQLQNNIGQFLDVTMDIAEGDLTKRGTVTEDILGNVVDSINLMTEELGYVLTGTRDAAFSVTQGSQQMLGSTEAIRSGTLKTTETAQRVAEQTRSVTKQIAAMARNAQSSAQAARQALEASLQGQQAVRQTLGGMESIRESSQTTAQRITELSQRSKEIGNIVDTISQIASQTNLLSLHASIEAAGAGEAGERFRVVADEVRELADQSAQAATQITALIAGIQREIAELTAAIRENTERVNQGYEVAGTAGSSLEQIGELSRESARLAEQISLTTREQVENIQTVNASVQEIASTAEESQRSVDQGRAAAEQLQQLANQLTESLARFRLPKA